MFKRNSYGAVVVLLVAAALAFYFGRGPEHIAIHIGKSFDTVASDSTFPVKDETAIYPSDPPHPSSTWISTPVVITFDDKQHGFTLPATQFGAIGWSEFKAITLTTSPMMETVPFEQAVKLLDELQQMFKKAGWAPESVQGNDWLKIETDEDKVRLQAKLFEQLDGVILLIPHKYSLILHIKCYVRCDERNTETAKYLIDVGLGEDHFSD
ncbi:hypothetical protein BK666_28385 [Pseudomonas frederiksbergensis]|uniref:Uncharacterized protein n=1 Tax=Pseudomonas frederiksbergensis TaxID=104087 RepID=A0A423JM03_9PSED|nr:hypothetical protein [Pseudomonas frederiksbergensis]RON38730.1 hypothetical protein BK666_28385 [Pseudomonas frederiksbergensis]